MVRKKPSLAGRAMLAVALMIGFYVLALLICGLLAALCYWDLQSGRVHPKIWIIAAVTIGVVIWSVWPRKAKFPDPGVPLTREGQPRLWEMVEDIAAQAGQAPPRRIFLVPEINAFVGERNSRLGFGGERIMGIGLPLLQVLSLPQVKSVIAHEFGHFHGGDTRLGPFIYRTRAAIGRTVQNFEKAESWMGKPFEWYGTMFLKATFAISRAQEYAADALSVQLVGLEPVQTALRRVNEVGPLYDHYLDQEYFPMLNRGVRPPLADGFVAFLGSESMKKVQVQLGEDAMQARGDKFDSHPPLSERLQAAADVEDPGDEPAKGPRASKLLDDIEELEGRLLAFLTGHEDVRDVPAASWNESGKAIAREWLGFACEEGRKLPATPVEDLGARAVDLESIAFDNNPDIPTEHRRAAGAWMVGSCLANALTERGFEVVNVPGNPIEVVRGEHRFQPYESSQQLAQERFDDADWRARCQRAGVEGMIVCGPEMPLPERDDDEAEGASGS